MTRPVHPLVGWTVALAIAASGGFAEMVGAAVTGTPTSSLTPIQGEGAGVSEASPWLIARPRAVAREASRSRHPDHSPAVGGTGTLNWTALAQCESNGDPRAVSASGKYRGAFQADADFWRTYDGLRFASRPDLATYAEQLEVAQAGYAARGRAPWPVCGRRL